MGKLNKQQADRRCGGERDVKIVSDHPKISRDPAHRAQPKTIPSEEIDIRCVRIHGAVPRFSQHLKPVKTEADQS